LFTRALDSKSTMRQSFLNDTWKEIYELRLNDDELVSETNWSEAIDSQAKSNSINIRIVLKPPVALQEHQTLLPREISQDLPPAGGKYYPDSGGLKKDSGSYRGPSMFSQRPMGNRIARIESSLDDLVLPNHKSRLTGDMNAPVSQFPYSGSQPVRQPPNRRKSHHDSRRSRSAYLERPPRDTISEPSQGADCGNTGGEFSAYSLYTPRNPGISPSKSPGPASEASYHASIAARYYAVPAPPFVDNGELGVFSWFIWILLFDRLDRLPLISCQLRGPLYRDTFLWKHKQGQFFRLVTRRRDSNNISKL